MKIHLRQIPVGGLHLSGDDPCPIPELANEDVRCVGPLHYELDAGVSDGALWAKGTLAQPVELTCVACLEKFLHTIRVPAFALHTELGGPETVDLSPFFREDILLNLPAHPHCDRNADTPRVCPAPPARSGAADDPAEDIAVPKPDWSALDKLDL